MKANLLLDPCLDSWVLNLVPSCFHLIPSPVTLLYSSFSNFTSGITFFFFNSFSSFVLWFLTPDIVASHFPYVKNVQCFWPSSSITKRYFVAGVLFVGGGWGVVVRWAVSSLLYVQSTNFAALDRQWYWKSSSYIVWELRNDILVWFHMRIL